MSVSRWRQLEDVLNLLLTVPSGGDYSSQSLDLEEHGMQIFVDWEEVK